MIVAAAGKLVAYEAATGVPRWFGPDGGAGYSSPHLLTIHGVPQILLLDARGATSVAPADGARLWELAVTSSALSAPIIQPALTPDGDVLIGDGQASGMYRIAVSQGAGGWTVAERWKSTALKPLFNDFVVHKGHAFGFDGSILACIDLADGKRKWKGGRYGNGQLILLADQDLLLVVSEEGELALVAAASTSSRSSRASQRSRARRGTTPCWPAISCWSATAKRWPPSGSRSSKNWVSRRRASQWRVSRPGGRAGYVPRDSLGFPWTSSRTKPTLGSSFQPCANYSF